MRGNQVNGATTSAVRESSGLRYGVVLAASLVILSALGLRAVLRHGRGGGRAEPAANAAGEGEALAPAGVAAPTRRPLPARAAGTTVVEPAAAEQLLEATDPSQVASLAHEKVWSLLRKSGGTGYPKWNAGARTAITQLHKLDVVANGQMKFGSLTCFDAGCVVDIVSPDVAKSPKSADIMWTDPIASYPGPKAFTDPMTSANGQVVNTLAFYNPEMAGFSP